MRRLFAICTLAAVAVWPAARGETLQTTEGRSLDGTLVAIDAKQVTFRGKAGEERLPLSGVREVHFGQGQSPDALATPGQHVATAEDGSRLVVKNEKITDGKLTGTCDLVTGLSVPVEGLAQLYRPRGEEKPSDLERQADAQKLTRSDKDGLLVNSAGNDWVGLAGLLSALDADKLTLNYEGADTTMEAKTVAAVVFARIGNAPKPAEPVAQLLGTDGSRLAVLSLEAAGKELRATTPSLGKLTVNPARVAAIRFSNGALAYLSDLTPTSATQTAFFDEVFPHRKDLSAGGTPLKVKKVAYEKGFGLHARCTLSFDLAGSYKQLTAAAGIDDSARTGAATLEVVGDGKALLPPTRLDSGQAAQSLRLDLTGVKTLTIKTDFVEGTCGAGARVDLCDPMLTK